ncbi:P-loop ATPase, Sll1717 family [Aeromonas caviae]|uniref:P-loop ATPase, Sll1717 family n=1 Tax=Aeromonas caviae TaxID=648 RepID=UPI0038D07C11
MSNLPSLIKYFKGGSAEAEKDIRGEVFIPPGNIDTLMSFDFHSNVILLGNKGVGKSIFVNVLHEAYLENDELSLLITPNDLECDPILRKKTLSDRKSTAYGQILQAISGIIGKYSNENEIAISSDVASLQKIAIKDGFSKPDLISRFSNILAKVAPYGGKIAKALLDDQARELGKNNLTEVVDKYLSNRGKTLWLFIDDIDEAGAKNSKGIFDYGACWAIVAAALELSEDIEALKCVVSVRSDIWHLMTKTHKHGTERKDKLGQIHELKFSEEELRAIFNLRIELAAKDAKSHKGQGTFFQQENITLPGNKGTRRSWDQWLAKQARYRPRDLVKAVQMLITATRKSESQLIGDAQAHSILLDFGTQRIENIVDEYGQICPQIKEVINDLTVHYTYSFSEIMEILLKVPSRRATQIDGIAMQPINEHAINLLHLLHMACFINPRLDSDDEYKHFNYNEYPDIIDISKFNDLQRLSWQIHPTFHAYVAEQQKKDRFRI